MQPRPAVTPRSHAECDSSYIIISGPPCTGKTRLATWLSKELHIPYFERDQIMTIILEKLGAGNRVWKKRVSAASYRLLYYFTEILFAEHTAFIVESCFRPADDSSHFRQLQSTYSFWPIQIHCTANLQFILDCYRRRSEEGLRHPGWLDDLENLDHVRDLVTEGMYDALTIGGSLFRIKPTEMNEGELTDLLKGIRLIMADIHHA